MARAVAQAAKLTIPDRRPEEEARGDPCNPWSEPCEHDWSGAARARESANQRRGLTGD